MSLYHGVNNYIALLLFSTEYFKDLLNYAYSSNNPARREREEAGFMFFMDFCEECEGNTIIIVKE